MQRGGNSGHRILGRVAWLGACAACAILLRAAPAHAAQTDLLSLTGLPLADGEYVSGFEVQTWSVEVLAVCRLPTGWTVTAGNGGDPGGVLSGSANIGAAFVGRERLNAFGSMFLVRVGRYRAEAMDDPSGAHFPATFAGTAAIGRYGQDGTRQVTLSGLNVRRRAAARCPVR